jgi:hypothetical protein
MDDEFFKGNKNHSMTFFGEAVKLSAIIRLYGMLKDPTSMKDILCWQNSTAISQQASPALLLDVSACSYHSSNGLIRND